MSWMECSCGFVFHDNSDGHYWKGHLITDKDWFPLLNMADSLIESPDPDREALCHTLSHNLSGQNACVQERLLYQCPECGRVYIENPDGRFFCFAPEDPDCDKMLFNHKGTGIVQPVQRSIPKKPNEE